MKFVGSHFLKVFQIGKYKTEISDVSFLESETHATFENQIKESLIHQGRSANHPRDTVNSINYSIK